MPIDYSTYYTEGTYTLSNGWDVKYIPKHNPDVEWNLTGNAFGLLFHKEQDNTCFSTVTAMKSRDKDEMVLFNRHLISAASIPVELFNKVFKEVSDINSEGENDADN